MDPQLEFHDSVAVLTLNRPQVLNALSFFVLRALATTLDAVAKSDARALIVTGAGEKSFCAGADIPELMNRTLDEQKQGALLGQAVFSRLERLPMPSVALVNGYAFGGGLELALACTFRLATANARFGLPEVKLGLIPGYGGTQRLPRLVGEGRALEMILTGKTVNASDALAMGLVNRIVEAPALDAALAFSQEFTGYGLLALKCAREAVQRGMQTSLSEGLRIEADLSTLAYRTADAEEGMKAFVEKRAAKFKDA